ncbi:MAG: alpha/beta hydrolase [Acidimicrobiia bacterium]|nr:alpha/beta hydrolase [Acidimicrobiia bacterium]
MSLATTRVGADTASRHLVMLHGIYGRGRNWQTIAKAVVSARPEYACWLVDLPRHGDSGAGAHGDGVRGFAADIDDWLRNQGPTPDVLLGHSFGGKVALAMAEHRRSEPLQVWVIDSTPETKAAGGSAWQMLELVRSLPETFPSRESATDAIAAGGYSRGVAVWMSTNLIRESDHFVWRLDFDVMDQLLHNFFTTDLWSVVTDRAPGHDLHFLRASTSSAMSDAAALRVESLADVHVHLHRREGTHWIHSESPQVVIDLLLAHLPLTPG